MCASNTNPMAVSNIPPPNLCCKSAVDKLLPKIEIHQDWPVHADFFDYPSPQFLSQCHMWSDLPPVDMKIQRKEDWQSASITIHVTVVVPTTHQPGFDLSRCSWSLLNRFRTGQGPCKAFLYKWGDSVTELLVWW